MAKATAKNRLAKSIGRIASNSPSANNAGHYSVSGILSHIAGKGCKYGIMPGLITCRPASADPSFIALWQKRGGKAEMVTHTARR